MMRQGLLVGLILGMAGCVPCLYPLYTARDLVFEPGLPGRWCEETGEESWVFTRLGEKGYQLVYTDEEGRSATFDAYWMELRQTRFLDLFLTDADAGMNELAQMTLAPCHVFLRVDLAGDHLKMVFMSMDWLQKRLADHPRAVKHMVSGGDRIVLTADTRGLQRFVKRYLDTPEAWLTDDAVTLTRQEAVPGDAAP